MEFSEARRSHLAHVILKAFVDEGLATVEEGRDRWILSEIKNVFEREHALDVRIDAAARRKIDTLSRLVPVGSPEWDVLYRKYYEEESRRLKSSGG
jgi:hypothetical protein